MKTAPRLLGALILSSSLLAAAAVAAPPPGRDDVAALPPAPGERALENRLLAPCCYKQTLEVHDGDSAQALRLEIRSRLYAGESAASIEANMVERYGEAVRAAPQHDVLPTVAIGVLLALTAAGLWVASVLRRWRVRGAAAAAAPLPAGPAAGATDAWDERIDDELRALD